MMSCKQVRWARNYPVDIEGFAGARTADSSSVNGAEEIEGVTVLEVCKMILLVFLVVIFTVLIVSVLIWSGFESTKESKHSYLMRVSDGKYSDTNISIIELGGEDHIDIGVNETDIDGAVRISTSSDMTDVDVMMDKIDKSSSENIRTDVTVKQTPNQIITTTPNATG